MISSQAQAAIDGMLAARRNKKDTRFNATMGEWMEGVFAERQEGRRAAELRPLPDGLQLSYASADGVPGEWLRLADGATRDKVILFLHGGGFASGSAASRRKLAAKITLSARIDSLSIDYRQCPEYRFPAHVQDCVTAFLWLMKMGYAPWNICLFGESAGANLVLAMTHFLKDHHFPLPGCVCAFSPVVDMLQGYDSWITRATCDAMIGEDIAQEDIPRRLAEYRAAGNIMRSFYCAPQEAGSPYVSPVRGDFTGFPPLMLQVGEQERLYDDAIAVAQKAKAAGVDVTLREWEGLGHVFALFDCPETEEVCSQIGRFFAEPRERSDTPSKKRNEPN